MFDFANDTMSIFGWSVAISSVMIWLSAAIGLVINFIYNRAEFLTQLKRQTLKETARAAFIHAERIAQITPMKGDDKLFEFMRYALKAYKRSMGFSPSQAEIEELNNIACELAEYDKVKKVKAEKLTINTPVTASFESIGSESVVVSKTAKKPAKKAPAKKKPAKKAPAKKKPAKKK